MKPKKTQEPLVFKHCSLPLQVTIRLCTRSDLPHLEWYGMFTSHRQIIRQTFKAQERGEALMLMAETNCLPGGQLWINLTRNQDGSAAWIWAMRVIPWLQRMGIGSCLISAAEEILAKRGFLWAELGVEKDNPDAQRFYEHRGYRMVGAEVEQFSYTTPGGVTRHVTVDQWVFRKHLLGAESETLFPEHVPVSLAEAI